MIAAAIVIGFLALAVAMGAPRRKGRRKGRLPASEQFVHSLLSLAAWIERTATAIDAGIVRYRLDRRMLCIDMESTRARLTERNLIEKEI